jgi:REP element-mobilizing transposase RayT
MLHEAKRAPGPAWHSRGYLPHWEAGEIAQSITFRLADSLPSALLERWRVELAATPAEKRDDERRRRLERALDSGHGSGVLAKPAIGRLVEDALLHFDAQRYRLFAWSIMPNHVHVLAMPLGEQTLSDVVHSWKSFTAKKANSLLKQQSAFWAPEYFDRAIRDDRHYSNAVDYLAMNPVKAGLCARPEDWRFSSSWDGRAPLATRRSD